MQFENFRAVYDKEKQDLLPVVDAEDDGTKGLSKSEIQLLLKTFCKLCKSYYGHTPIIYCSESYFKDYLSPEFDNYYLWIASYDHEPVLPGKPHYDIWQYSKHGRVPGVWNWVDLNRFAKNRSLSDIRIKQQKNNWYKIQKSAGITASRLPFSLTELKNLSSIY